MTRLLESATLNDAQRVGALDLRADARDARDLAEQAFADYAARNAILHRVNAPRVAAERLRERGIDQALRLGRWFEGAAPDSWPASDAPIPGRCGGMSFWSDSPFRNHLSKALACHPDITTLEEVDHLAAVGGHWLAGETGLRQLDGRGRRRAGRRSARAYWNGVQDSVGALVGGSDLRRQVAAAHGRDAAGRAPVSGRRRSCSPCAIRVTSS